MWRCIVASLFILTYCMGIGFIVIPLVITLTGFWPAILAIILIGLFSICTGSLYLEATLACPKGANVFSISRRLIGRGSAGVCAGLFLYSHYSFAISYLILAIPVVSASAQLLGLSIGLLPSCLIIAILVGGSAYLGTTFSFYFNSVYVVGILVIFGLIPFSGIDLSIPHLIAYNEWVFLFFSFPFLYNVFFYQTVIPTTAQFLDYDRKKCLITIWIGISISTFIFILWMWLSTGSNIEFSIFKIFQSNMPVHEMYLKLIQIPKIGGLVLFLILLCLISTAITVFIVLIDFLSDTFGIPLSERKGFKRAYICLLVLLPTLLISLYREHQILRTIHYSVGFVDIFLSPILPIWWVWQARYTYKLVKHPIVKGGKLGIAFLILLTIALVYIEAIRVIYQFTW